MAAILRSSIGKTIRRVSSLEGTLSGRLPWPRRHLLHTGNTADGTHQVDPLAKKIDETATLAVLVEYTQGLVREEKTKIVSPSLRGIAMPWLLGLCCIGLYGAGYQLGFHQATEKECQES